MADNDSWTEDSVAQDSQSEGEASDPTKDILSKHPAASFAVYVPGHPGSEKEGTRFPTSYVRYGKGYDSTDQDVGTDPEKNGETAELSVLSHVERAGHAEKLTFAGNSFNCWAPYSGHFVYSNGTSQQKFSVSATTTVIGLSAEAEANGSGETQASESNDTLEATPSSYLRLGLRDTLSSYGPDNGGTWSDTEDFKFSGDKAPDDSSNEVGVYLFSTGTYRSITQSNELWRSISNLSVLLGSDGQVLKAAFEDSGEAGTPVTIDYNFGHSYEAVISDSGSFNIGNAQESFLGNKQSLELGTSVSASIGLLDVSVDASLCSVKLTESELKLEGAIASDLLPSKMESAASKMVFTVNPARMAQYAAQSIAYKIIVALLTAGGVAVQGIATAYEAALSEKHSYNPEQLKQELAKFKTLSEIQTGILGAVEVAGLILALVQLAADKLSAVEEMTGSTIRLDSTGITLSSGPTSFIRIGPGSIVINAPSIMRAALADSVSPAVVPVPPDIGYTPPTALGTIKNAASDAGSKISDAGSKVADAVGQVIKNNWIIGAAASPFIAGGAAVGTYLYFQTRK